VRFGSRREIVFQQPARETLQDPGLPFRAAANAVCKTAVLQTFLGARRSLLRRLGALALLPLPGLAHGQGGPATDADRRWMDLAFEMRRLAESWGDQPYGAVLVLEGALIGAGPSRVVKLGNPDAHAEREAIRDAQRRLGRADLHGSVLYSTSRPCSLCERAAAAAGVGRMIHGATLRDAGPPRS
jgi:tRNA(adenine34) deaminase